MAWAAETWDWREAVQAEAMRHAILEALARAAYLGRGVSANAVYEELRRLAHEGRLPREPMLVEVVEELEFYKRLGIAVEDGTGYMLALDRVPRSVLEELGIAVERVEAVEAEAVAVV